MPKRTLVCKSCGKRVKVNRYKGRNDNDYLCAVCRIPFRRKKEAR